MNARFDISSTAVATAAALETTEAIYWLKFIVQYIVWVGEFKHIWNVWCKDKRRVNWELLGIILSGLMDIKLWFQSAGLQIFDWIFRIVIFGWRFSSSGACFPPFSLSCLKGQTRGVFRGPPNPPFFWEKFFNLLGVFKKKMPKPPLNFPVHTKKFKTTPSKNFWIRPWDKLGGN